MLNMYISHHHYVQAKDLILHHLHRPTKKPMAPSETDRVEDQALDSKTDPCQRAASLARQSKVEEAEELLLQRSEVLPDVPGETLTELCIAHARAGNAKEEEYWRQLVALGHVPHQEQLEDLAKYVARSGDLARMSRLNSDLMVLGMPDETLLLALMQGYFEARNMRKAQEHYMAICQHGFQPNVGHIEALLWKAIEEQDSIVIQFATRVLSELGVPLDLGMCDRLVRLYVDQGRIRAIWSLVRDTEKSNRQLMPETLEKIVYAYIDSGLLEDAGKIVRDWNTDIPIPFEMRNTLKSKLAKAGISDKGL
eukprot:NODE_847_length_1413_cov_119.582111_g704_i0.p1 GENE.NODE_847_length_1413_cov_119.582111_g704_i0~~NODE_847_length_1413_cov_119.582111_g704_i0.p1  ORF type:complete len:309 (-),score=85.42 NODE_847_length_1413_cov_119.582111_g704_i0:25-951(-)